MATTKIDFTGTYWNQQTFVLIDSLQPPAWSIECHDPATPFAFRPNGDVGIQADSGSMRLEKTSQGVRYLTSRTFNCSGRPSKTRASVISINFSNKVEIDWFRITMQGADNNPSGGTDYAAYLAVPRKIFTVPTGTAIVTVTSQMLGTGGRIGPIRFVQIHHNRPENRILKFEYNVAQRMGRGDNPGFPPIWG